MCGSSLRFACVNEPASLLIPRATYGWIEDFISCALIIILGSPIAIGSVERGTKLDELILLGHYRKHFIPFLKKHITNQNNL